MRELAVLAVAVASAAVASAPAGAALRDVATARIEDRGRIVVTLSRAPAAVEASIVGDQVRLRLAGVAAAETSWEPAGGDLLRRFDTRSTEGGLEILFSLAVPPTAVRATATPSGAVLDISLTSSAPSTAHAEPQTRGLYAATAHHGGPGGHFPRALPPPETSHQASAPEPTAHAAGPASAARAEAPSADHDAPSDHREAHAESAEAAASYEVAAAEPEAAGSIAAAVESDDSDVAAAIAEAVAAAEDEFTEFAGEHGSGTDGLRARPPERADRADPTRILVDRVDPAACLESAAAIADDPWNLDHLEPHAQCLLHEGDAENAAAVYERLLTFAPDAPGAHLGLGVAKQAMGDARAARQHFEDARVLALSDSDAMRARALLDQLGN